MLRFCSQAVPGDGGALDGALRRCPRPGVRPVRPRATARRPPGLATDSHTRQVRDPCRGTRGELRCEGAGRRTQPSLFTSGAEPFEPLFEPLLEPLSDPAAPQWVGRVGLCATGRGRGGAFERAGRWRCRVHGARSVKEDCPGISPAWHGARCKLLWYVGTLVSVHLHVRHTAWTVHKRRCFQPINLLRRHSRLVVAVVYTSVYTCVPFPPNITQTHAILAAPLPLPACPVAPQPASPAPRGARKALLLSF